MRHRPRLWLMTVAALLVVLTIAGDRALAQSGGDYDLSWSTVDSGGGVTAGGSFRLAGTAGQADAGVMSGGGFRLEGGFWPGVEVRYEVFIPVVVRDYP